MDKALNILQKEINLHVNDIERMQNHISRLATIMGNQADELRRNKEKSRKTQSILSQLKKVQPSTIKNTTKTGSSPERTLKQTTMSGTTTGTTPDQAQNSLIIDLLLFGP
jgi:REP element-mobilizing transposase RayT